MHCNIYVCIEVRKKLRVKWPKGDFEKMKKKSFLRHLLALCFLLSMHPFLEWQPKSYVVFNLYHNYHGTF